MKKDKVLRIRMSDNDKSELEEASKLKDVSSSEFARDAINNKVKRTLSKGK